MKRLEWAGQHPAKFHPPKILHPKRENPCLYIYFYEGYNGCNVGVIQPELEWSWLRDRACRIRWFRIIFCIVGYISDRTFKFGNFFKQLSVSRFSKYLRNILHEEELFMSLITLKKKCNFSLERIRPLMPNAKNWREILPFESDMLMLHMRKVLLMLLHHILKFVK